MSDLLDVTERLKEQLRIKDKTAIPVLIVEDDSNDMDFMKVALGSAGCLVVCCYSGSDAINTIAKNPGKFLIAFLDLKMPEPDGVKVFNFIQKTSPETQIVIVTGTDLVNRLPKTESPLWVVQKPLTSRSAEKIVSKSR